MNLKGQNCFLTVNVKPKILKLKCTVLDHTVQREGTFLLRSLPKYVPSLQKTYKSGLSCCVCFSFEDCLSGRGGRHSWKVLFLCGLTYNRPSSSDTKTTSWHWQQLRWGAGQQAQLWQLGPGKDISFQRISRHGCQRIQDSSMLCQDLDFGEITIHIWVCQRNLTKILNIS